MTCSAAARYISIRIGGVEKHLADIVEAVADVVGRETRRPVQIDADQVADRVIVLSAIQPAERDVAGGHSRSFVVAARSRHDDFELGRIGTRLAFRRHALGSQVICHALQAAVHASRVIWSRCSRG